ncbi:hypothetical protein BDV26DRAFT_231168 [Aspergillus bertholletiae]|uniref:Uncharacterized protein n=1 Tax=Aspergillus bertholletiae TaxID=1226010 RepID=A0A5N7B646_9EURO|nr:hypothetical protein BDV26DRAFT_231168 [Aspergillus bertholletiae]
MWTACSTRWSSEACPHHPEQSGLHSTGRNASSYSPLTMFGAFSLVSGFPNVDIALASRDFNLHFISDDRAAEGHVTGFEAWDVKLSAEVLKEYRVELPQAEDFHEVPVWNHDEGQNYAAEGHGRV